MEHPLDHWQTEGGMPKPEVGTYPEAGMSRCRQENSEIKIPIMLLLSKFVHMPFCQKTVIFYTG